MKKLICFLILGMLLTSNSFAADSTNPNTENIPVEDNINDDDDSTTNDQQPPDTNTTKPVTPPPVVTPPVADKPYTCADKENYKVLENFDQTLTPGLTLNLKYNNYIPAFNYVLVNSKPVTIRQFPCEHSASMRVAPVSEKINMMQIVKGEWVASLNTDRWYKVYWYYQGNLYSGFIPLPLVEKREFQVKKMHQRIVDFAAFTASNQMGYVSNYKNGKGLPPAINGKNYDFRGNPQDQSAIGYKDLNSKSGAVYIPDGTLVAMGSYKNGFVQVKPFDYPDFYWVSQKYLTRKNAPSYTGQVVIIDRKNQNEMVFEQANGGWQIVSYTFATTGVKAQYKFETPLGCFMPIEKKPQFLYLKDGTSAIAGYAPYAIRFTGGGYIHGVPVAYRNDKGKQVDPGMKEFLLSIGTYAKSHKCVRNYTSHAKFLYDWLKIGSSSIMVIE